MTSTFCPVHYGACPISGKTSYLRRCDAKRVARWSTKRGAGRISVYRCDDHWHLGHLGPYRIANGRHAA